MHTPKHMVSSEQVNTTDEEGWTQFAKTRLLDSVPYPERGPTLEVAISNTWSPGELSTGN